jgi:hypothetical protein
VDSCEFCKNNILPDNPFIYWGYGKNKIGKFQQKRNLFPTLFFHLECFEIVAGEEYTQKLNFAQKKQILKNPFQAAKRRFYKQPPPRSNK